MNVNIFRQYDIRGKVDADLTEDIAFLVGKAYGSIVRRKGFLTVTSGRDGRLHSRRLQEKLIGGIISTGCNVIDVGECPTPLLYFSIFHWDTDGGIQVTGSHNPAEYNGFKICLQKDTLHGEDIQAIRRLIEEKDFIDGSGSVENRDVHEPYWAWLKANIRLRRPVKVVIDAGNGVAGSVAPRAFKDQRCEVIELFCDVDGRFPNHHPDPTVPANLKALIAEVTEVKADLGIAFDGDGDRIGVVDEKGGVIYGDKLMILLARRLLQDNPGAAVIGEVKCSHLMYEDIKRGGGRPIMWKTGHSLIKSKMKEEKALLAGEMSGHIFFADRYFGYDDAIYAGLRLAELLAEQDKPISELLSDLPQTFSTPEIRVDCPDDLKFKVVDEAVKWFKIHYDTIDIDGARITFKDGWGLVRASNTQPVLVSRFEAQSHERLAEIQNLMESKLKEIIANFNAFV